MARGARLAITDNTETLRQGGVARRLNSFTVDTPRSLASPSDKDSSTRRAASHSQKSGKKVRYATLSPETKTRSRTGRRQVRHLVDKTYMDDKGYMVTKKEYESASESDTEEAEKKSEKKVTTKKREKVNLVFH